MPLPLPSDSATVSAPVVAAPVASAAVAVTGKATRQVAKFGAARGDSAVAVPVINGVNAAVVFAAFQAALMNAGVTDLHQTVEAFRGTPKSLFPGNKEGRSAFALGNILLNIEKATSTKVKGPKKPRVKQADKIKALFAALKSKLGAANVDAALDPEFLKGLGL